MTSWEFSLSPRAEALDELAERAGRFLGEGVLDGPLQEPLLVEVARRDLLKGGGVVQEFLQKHSSSGDGGALGHLPGPCSETRRSRTLMMSNVPVAVEEAYELTRWLLPRLDRFPRSRKFTLGRRLAGIP